MTEGIIGGVGVAVTPDAQDFWLKFEQQTRAGATDAGRKSGEQWRRGFDTTSQDTVRIGADTRAAEAKLAALRGQVERGATFNIRTDGSLSAGQLASITAATNKLSDAQYKLRDARAQQQAIAHKEGVTDDELAAASEKVTRAQRDEALSALRLSAAQESVAESQDRAARSAEKEALAQQKAASSTSDNNKQSIGLLGTLAALSPALTPIAATAGLAGAALASMAIQGTLAVKGAQAAFKAANADGVQFAGSLNVAKQDLAQLEATAAHGVLTPFQQAVTRAHAAVPALNADLAQSSKVLGSIGGHLVNGLLGGERTFTQPLLAVEGTVNQLATRFESWATGPGGTKFAATLSSDFRQVEPVLASLGTAIAHIVAASNGPGLFIVKEIGQLADVLNALPQPVLTALIDSMIALKISSAVAVGLNLASAALVKFAAAEDVAAVSSTRLATAETEAAAASGRVSLAYGGGAAAAGAGGFRGFAGKAGGAALRFVGPALAAYFGSQYLSNQTAGSRTSADPGQFFGANFAQGAGNLFSGHFGSIVSDARNNQISRDISNSTLNRYYKATSPAYIPQGQLGLQGGNLFSPYNPNAYGGQLLGRSGNSEITSGHGSVGPVSSAAALQGFFGSGGHGTAIGSASGAAGGRGVAISAASATAAAKAITQLTGAERIGLEKTAVYQQAHVRLAQAFSQVTSAAPHQTVTELASSYTSLSGNLQKSIDTQSKFLDQGGKTVTTIDGVKIGEKTLGAALQLTNGDYQKAQGLLEGRVKALHDSQSQAKVAADREERLSSAVGAAGLKYGITADQVGQYAQIVGISSEKVAEGAITQKQFVTAIGEVKHAVDQGNTAVQGWATAVQAFDKAGDTAASRAQLIGAALVSFNGDAIQFQSAIANSAAAGKQFVTDFDNVGKSVLNLKTGTLDYHRAAAAPLLSDLGQLQTAAQNAAVATYQHEAATKGQSQAAADAARIYRSQTYGALQGEAGQLGLTSGQAHKLAQEYFGIPKDVVTRIRQLGATQTNTLLSALGRQLSYLTHKPWTFNVNGNTENAMSRLNALLAKIPHGTFKFSVIEEDKRRNANPFGPDNPTGKAAGGSAPEGMFSVGERGPEIVSKRGSRVDILSNSQSKRFISATGARFPGFAGGSLSGNAASIAAALSSILGLDRSGIAGVLGNLKIESDLNPRAIGGPAHGIAQWQGGRFGDLQAFAKSQNRQWTNLKVQEEFLAKELKGMPGLLHTLRTGGSATNAASLFDQIFERSDGTARGARESAAAGFARQLRNTNLSKGGKTAAGSTAPPVPTLASIRALQTALKNISKEALTARLGINKLGTDLNSSASTAYAAYGKVDAQLQKLGAPKGVLNALRTMNAGLDKEISNRNGTNVRIANLVKAEADLASQVKSSFAGSFDVTSAGTGPSGSGGVSFSSIFAQAEQDQLKASQADAGIRKLAKLGLNKTEQVQLANAGPAALPQILALEHASKGQIASLNSENASIGQHGQNIGNFVGGQVYGGSITSLENLRARQNTAIHNDYVALQKDVRALVTLLEEDRKRPIVVEVNDREIARANRSGTKRATR